MLRAFRFFRGCVFGRVLGTAIVIAVLFIAGCTTNGSGTQFGVTTTSGQLATVVVNAVYPGATLTAANGTAPYTWAITSGALPTGLSLSSAGVLSGTPTAFGTFNFTVTVTDSATPPHTATASLSVLINPALASVTLNPTTVTGGTSSTGTVTLNGAAAAAATVTLSSSSGAATVPATATVAAGSTTGTFQVATSGVTASTPATITATYGVAKTAALTVNPPTVLSVVLAQSTVTGGTGTTGTVTLTGSAATGGDVVTLSSTNTAATPQATVTVLAGAATAQFSVTTVTVGTTATGNIQASFNSSSQTAALTVVPAPTITSFTAAAATITSGASTTLMGVFSNGTGSISNGVGAVTSGTLATVSPTATTTYTLTVTNAAGTAVTKQATVTVVAAPAITSFAAAAATITAGTSTTLTGVFSNGTGSVDNSVGAVTSGTAATVSPASTTTYTLTVTNTAGATVTKQATVTVVAAPGITSFASALATIVSGNTTSLTAVFTNGTGTVNNGVGAVISGTPVNITPTATTTYTLTVSNAATTPATVTATTTVIVDVPPAFTTANNTTFTVGSNGSFTVRTSGNPVAALTGVGALPGTVTFHDNGDGTATISGTPTGSPASYPITITANNGVAPNATQTFTLNVALVQAPAITSANNVTFTAGLTGTFTVTTTGSPTAALTAVGALPGTVTFHDNGNGTATVSGIPAAPGSSPITITANNGVAPNAQQTFTLNVVAAPTITSFTAAPTTITVGSSTTLTAAFSGGTGSVDNGVGAVTTTVGVTVSPAATTTYTLTVTNTATTPATATLMATVTVDPAPIITSFTATSLTIVSGTSTTLTPTFSNGTGTISPTVGAVSSGTGYSVSPTTTTTYTLTVTNSAGSKLTSTVTITVNAPPQITSGNSTTFAVGVNGTFTVTTSGSPIPSLSITSGSLPSPVTFVDNGNGTATISGTPTAASVNPVTITANNGVSPNAAQSFTLNVTNNSGQISGQISLSNTCGGSVTLPTFTVTINTTPAQQAQTDTSGNYSFTSIPNGTYTIAPSISGAASSVFYPASYTGVVVNSGSVSGENFNAEVGYNISGNVSYTGSQTGQTYLYVQNSNCGGNGGPGTSITQATLTSGGAYTIHGVQPGNYTLNAWMDSTGVTSGTKYPGEQGQPNANDPTGSNSSVSVTTASVTGVGVTMSSPTYSTPSSNPAIQVFPSAGGVAIFYQPSTLKTANGNKEEDANEYVVEWAVTTGTDSLTNPTCALATSSTQFATVAGSHTFYAIGAHGGTVWILNNTMAGAGTFTSGQSYCFQAQAFNTLATTTHLSTWGTYTDGSGSPLAVKIGSALCSSNCTTVSGTVTIPSGITPASGAPLYVGFYQQSPSSNGPTALYATEISPVSGANSYSIAIPSGSNYNIFGILDQNNDGQIDAGDVTDTNNNNNSSGITVSGSTMTVNDNSLPATNSVATVQTQYSTCGTNCSNYNLNLQVREGNKLPVAVTLYSGPNLLNPVDMGQCSSCGSVQYQYSVSLPGGVPNVGDTYNFTVTYSDGSVDQGSAGTINGKVTAFGSTGAVVGPSDAPTNLLPNTTSGPTAGTRTQPTFTWTDSSNATGSNFSYNFSIYQSNGCSGNCNIWQIPSNNSNSNGFSSSITSLTWGTDPTGGGSTPSVSSLTTGTQYSWQIQVQDSNGNQAQTSVNYVP
jgi:hypothetical protein